MKLLTHSDLSSLISLMIFKGKAKEWWSLSDIAILNA